MRVIELLLQGLGFLISLPFRLWYWAAIVRQEYEEMRRAERACRFINAHGGLRIDTTDRLAAITAQVSCGHCSLRLTENLSAYSLSISHPVEVTGLVRITFFSPEGVLLVSAWDILDAFHPALMKLLAKAEQEGNLRAERVGMPFR